MSIIDEIIGVALDAHQELSGDDVTYQESPTSDVLTLYSATKSLKPWFLNQEAKFSIQTEVVDWIVKRSHFGIGANFIEPEEGALITEISGSLKREYRLARFEGEPVWFPLDSSESHIRIHTVRVSEVFV